MNPDIPRDHRDLVDSIAARDAVPAVTVSHGHVATLHDTMFGCVTTQARFERSTRVEG
jgi:DNA-binding FadR family transcriptional regulator